MANATTFHHVILLVDDDWHTRNLLRRALEVDGYTIEEAGLGEQALRIYPEIQPDIVLLDAMMPGMNGFEVCARLQELPAENRAFVLMITSLSDQPSIDRAFQAGAVDYITKPIDLAVLRHRLRQLLTTKAAEKILKAANAQLESSVEERTAELLAANQTLKEEIKAREHAEQQQSALVAGLREVLTGIDELMAYPDVDTLCHRAVEIAKTKLGLERCAIFLQKDGYLQGTYGTDRQGRTVSEHEHRILISDSWHERFQSFRPQDEHWIVSEEPRTEWDGEKSVPFSEGWIAVTQIRSAQHTLGVLCNDSAISNSPLDPSKQELVTVFCSLLASIIEQKQIQEALSNAHTQLELRVNERTAELAQANQALNAEILEHKRMEKALEESEGRFRVLFEASPDAILLIDPTDPVVPWRIVACNESACLMNGYTHDELIGQSIDLLNLPDAYDPVGHVAYYERLKRERMFSLETRHRRKDGTLIDIQTSTSLITLQNKQLVLGIDRDVTERNRMEMALLDQHERLEQLVDQRTLALTVTNEQLQQEILERKQMEAELEYRVQFEKLITNVSAHFINLQPDEIDEGIVHALRSVGEFVGVDSIYTALLTRDQTRFVLAHEWTVAGIAPRAQKMTSVSLDIDSAWRERIKQSDGVYVPCVADLPSQNPLRERLDKLGVLSHIAVPMIFGSDLIGFLGLDAIRVEKTWPREIVSLLKIVGETLVNALERKRTGEALFRSEEQLRRITDNMLDMIWQTDVGGSIEYASPSCLSVLGYEPETLIGHSIDTWLHPEDIESITQAFSTTDRFEYRYRHADGHYIWLESLTSLLLGADQEIKGIIFASRDITQRKQAEKELKELDLLKTEFLSTAAHELRTPLTSIQGFSEILFTRDLIPDRQRRYAKMINEQAVQLAEIIDSLLDVSRLEAKRRLTLTPEPINIGELIHKTVTPLAEASPTHPIRVEVMDLPAIVGDSSRLAQVIKNLISNAIKYSPEGTPILVRGEADEDSVRISVKDQGVGLTREQQAHLFEKFYRADASNTAINGTGLGLAICKLIVELHGGQIWAQSEYGYGSTFYFELPLTGAPVTTA